MTRVEKNNLKYKKRNKKANSIIRLLKVFIKYLIYFLTGLLYIIYLLINNFNLLVIKLYSKLPKILRTSIIYLLVFMAAIGTYKIDYKVNEAKFIKIHLPVFEEIDIAVAKTKDKTTCEFGEIECKIYDKAINNGLTYKQAILIIAISKHETGNWTSSAFKNKNNFGGVMCNTGLKSYKNFDDGLNGFVILLKNRYFDKGLTTIEEIGSVYCPIGASNDPTGLNKYWIPNVTKYFNEYLGG